jgi:hypothetical protein
LALKKDVSADVLVLLLNDYFPGLVFIPKNSRNISITKYVIQEEDGKWILDVKAMSKSKEKIFSNLFPEDISGWNEAEARTRYGCADIIRFFIDMKNDMFSAGFSNAALGKSIPDRFFEELDYYGKPVWEDWDFSALVIHRMRHHPPFIYEAFDFYAHRLYTLMGFGLGSGNTTDDELIKSGTELMKDTIREQIPETESFRDERRTAFFEMTRKTLESVPTGGSKYTPTEMDVFIKQLKNKVPNLYKDNRSWKETDSADIWSAYGPADRKTINNHIEKAEKHITIGEDMSALQRVKLSGTYREKINLLHRIVCGQQLEGYLRSERDTIHGLYLKRHWPIFLDSLLGSNKDNVGFTRYDPNKDDTYAKIQDHLEWSSFFRNEFEKELDKDSIEIFIKCLPHHFEEFPFDIDSDGNLSISKYSRKILFTIFCSVAGIAPDNELWKPFLVLMQRVVVNINKCRKTWSGKNESI